MVTTSIYNIVVNQNLEANPMFHRSVSVSSKLKEMPSKNLTIFRK